MSLLNNSIAFAQFRSRGGWKMMGIICGSYAVLVAGIMYLTCRMNPRDVPTVMMGWTIGLGVIHTLILLIFGATRVSGAIRQDLTGKMVESNRLMPISSAEAIAGYVVGAPSQAIGIAVTSVLLGCISSDLASFDKGEWLAINAFIALVVVSIWIMTAFGAFLIRGAPFVLAIPVVLVMMSQGEILRTLPGLALLIMPLRPAIRGIRLWPSRGMELIDLGAIAAFVAMGAIFFCGAARRYRRSDTPALGPFLGLLLLVLWMAMSVFAMLFWNESSFSFFFYPRYQELPPQIAGTLQVFLLLCIIPVGGMTLDLVRWQSIDPPDRAGERRPGSVILVALVAAAIGLTLAFVLPDRQTFLFELLPCVAAIALAMITLSMVIRVVASFSNRTILYPLGWIMLAWIGPFVADVIYQSCAPNYTGGGLTTISMISPMGIILAAWGQTPPDTPMPGLTSDLVGMGIQFGILIAWSLMAARWRRQPIRLDDRPSPGST